MSRTSIQLEEGSDEDRLELPGQPYALALWNLIIRPPRRRYDLCRLGPTEFRLWFASVKRVDIELTNSRGLRLKCSHFLPSDLADWSGVPGDGGLEARPVVIYLHQNASCRLEALNLVPLFLPLGISLFAFDFAGCGESDGEYISLGWYERDDLAEVVDYLRKTGKVSAIGLWGRSMGAVTALLHADRDHSIGGMVLDSPFCNLTTLATELAQSEYLAVKVPSWLLSGALALGRMRIKSLCGFDIDQLTPECHVGDSFVPALFIHGRGDDFIPPHHTQKLFDAYNGDKELEMVEGDHNSPRPGHLNRKAVLFFTRAFRCNPEPEVRSGADNLAAMLDVHPADLDCGWDQRALRRDLAMQAGELLAMMGSLPASVAPAPGSPLAARLLGALTQQRPWLGDRQQALLPIRAEGALQLEEPLSEAGFCVSATPSPSEWGGVCRPPEVFLAYAAVDGLHVGRCTEKGREALAHAQGQLDLAVPILCILELRQSPPRLKLVLGAGELELEYPLREECEPEVSIWLWNSRRGEVQFFDFALSELPLRDGDELSGQARGPGKEGAGAADRQPPPLPAPPQPAAPGGSLGSSAAEEARTRGDSASNSSGFCPTQ